jgi:hypothetical protein
LKKVSSQTLLQKLLAFVKLTSCKLLRNKTFREVVWAAPTMSVFILEAS